VAEEFPTMSKPPLNELNKKDLSDLARRKGVKGYESMTKEQLVKALEQAAKKASKTDAKPEAKPNKTAPAKASPNSAKTAPAKALPSKASTTSKTQPSKPATDKKPAPTAKTTTAPASAPAKPVPAKVPVLKPSTNGSGSAHTSRVEAVIPADKDLSMKVSKNGQVKDRIALSAPDAFWLHAFWEISLQSVQRAEAALAQDWHGAKPILRLFDVTAHDTTSTSEAPLRDIFVHGGCTHWYIDVPQPPRSYRIDIGYLTRSGRFFPLSRSNIVSPPLAGSSEVVDASFNNEARTERASEPPASPEDQFRRPLKDSPFGSGALLPGKLKKFFFDIDAELIVYVKTDPSATVSLQNEKVKLRADGTATMRFSLPDSRQIIPAVASSADGMEEQTIVLAVERNTKRLDPMVHDVYGEG
jgi:uncharacterized protein